MKLSDSQIQQLLKEVDGWEREGNQIARVYKFNDFNGSIDFVNRVAVVAEKLNQ